MRTIAMLAVLVVCAATACLATTPTSPGDTIYQPASAYPDCRQLNGSAKYIDGAVRLTDNVVSESGSMFAGTPVSISHFDTTFSFRMYGSDQNADGLTFCIQSDPNETRALGSVGGYLGYGVCEAWNTPGIARSVAIEFDDFCNELFKDLPNDHVGIDVNGSVISETQEASPVPLTIDVVKARVLYTRGYLNVYVWSGKTQPRKPLLRYQIDIPFTLRSSTGFVGFTAATAMNYQYTDVLYWAFNNAAYIPAPAEVSQKQPPAPGVVIPD